MGTRVLFAAMAWLIAAPAWAGLPFDPLPPQPPIPADNPQTPEKIELGKMLFFDRRLSVTGTHSCNSCHDLAAGGDDGRSVSVGALGRAGHRNALTLWNAAFHTVYNWDGSAPTLEAQFKAHVVDPNVMAMPSGRYLVSRLERIPGYVAAFEEVFGRLDFDAVARAVAAFERTLVTPGSAYDRYLEGEESALSGQARRGFETFIEIGCASCHFWVNLAGPIPGVALKQGEGFYELFPNHPGTAYEKRYRLADDLGRYTITQQEIDRRKWRMPGLRNVALTAPYFHNGSVKSLEEAVRVMALTQLKKRPSDEEVADIVAFLHSLTGPFPTIELPRLPPSPGTSVLDGHDDHQE